MIDIITLAVGFCCNKARCPSVHTFSMEHLCNGMTVLAARLPSYGKMECVNVSLPCHRQLTNIQALGTCSFMGLCPCFSHSED